MKRLVVVVLALALAGCAAHEENVHLYELSAAGQYNPFITARAGGLLVGVDGDWKGNEVRYEKETEDGAKIFVRIKGAVDDGVPD